VVALSAPFSDRISHRSMTRRMPNGLPRGSTYHSIHAKVGVGLANDEYIVYGLSQTTITHLIELGRT
jgi:hypothetical protein